MTQGYQPDYDAGVKYASNRTTLLLMLSKITAIGMDLYRMADEIAGAGTTAAGEARQKAEELTDAMKWMRTAIMNITKGHRMMSGTWNESPLMCWLYAPIDELDLTDRTMENLKKTGAKTVEDLLYVSDENGPEWDPDGWLSLRMLDEIIGAIEKLGFGQFNLSHYPGWEDTAWDRSNRPILGEPDGFDDVPNELSVEPNGLNQFLADCFGIKGQNEVST